MQAPGWQRQEQLPEADVLALRPSSTQREEACAWLLCSGDGWKDAPDTEVAAGPGLSDFLPGQGQYMILWGKHEEDLQTPRAQSDPRIICAGGRHYP